MPVGHTGVLGSVLEGVCGRLLIANGNDGDEKSPVSSTVSEEIHFWISLHVV